MTATALVCYVVLMISIATTAFKTVSHTSIGTWSNATEEECSHFLCSPKKETWRPIDPDFRFYNSTTGCEALLRKNITHIHFNGDSYMRQMYSAMLITLLGDFQYGSIKNHTATPKCSYHRQFHEKTCGLKELNFAGWVCDRKVLLNPMLYGYDNFNECHPGHVKLWSFGNHKLGPARFGINDAKAYSGHYERILCPKVRDAANRKHFDGSYANSCQVFWVSTHYRIVGWFDDEKEPIVHEFNRGMREFFDSGKCGPINYIDVYNMTLGLKNKTENVELSYDRVHWGMEVNLVKAQILLNVLINQH